MGVSTTFKANTAFQSRRRAVVLGRNGVETILELLNCFRDKKRFRKSIAVVKEAIRELGVGLS
jgi:malate/lactate dehydrogenase